MWNKNFGLEEDKMKKTVRMITFACMCAVCLVGCRHKITDETKNALETKTSQALELYADINKTVEENQLETNESFVNMKSQLTDMATKIKGKIDEATEEDGQLAVKKVEGIISNLNEVKAHVEQSLEEKGS